jgi:hypothetical protein
MRATKMNKTISISKLVPVANRTGPLSTPGDTAARLRGLGTRLTRPRRSCLEPLALACKYPVPL